MNRMEKNYENMKNHQGSLKESVDVLRTSVKDLYELDEDNYQLIKSLTSRIDSLTKTVDKVNRRSRRLLGGLVILGVGGFLLSSIVDGLNDRTSSLEEDANAPKEVKEESDG